MKLSLPSFTKKQPRRRLPKTKQRQARSLVAPNRQAQRRREFLVKLVKYLATGLFCLLLISLLAGGFNLRRLRSLDWRAGKYQDLGHWQGEDNLNVLLLGIDEQPGGLQFVDSLQLLYFQPQSRKVDILVIDPDLHFQITNDDDTLAEPITTAYSYRQLYNFYLLQDKLNGTNVALDEFVFTIGSELGLHIDRYLLLKQANFTTLIGPVGSIRLPVNEDIIIPSEEIKLEKGTRALPPRQQLDYIAAKQQTDNAATLLRQLEYLRRLLIDLRGNWTSIKYIVALSQLPKPTDLLTTNCSGNELWQLYNFIRKANKYSYSGSIIGQQQMYILQGKRYLDKKAFDDQIRKLYLNQEIIKEQARIDVINGAAKPGLANKTKRILTNHSFNIVRVANSEERYERPVLYITEPELYPQTMKQLKHHYPDLIIRNEDYLYRPTGDMVLVVV